MSNQCSEGFSFAPLAAEVALDAIFLIVFCVNLIVWLVLRLTKISRKSALKWYFYGISLICIIIATFLDIVANTLTACHILGIRKNLEIGAASSWFYWLSSILFLATVLIPVAGAFYKAAYARPARLIYVVGSATIGFISIFVIAHLGVSTQNVTIRRLFVSSTTSSALSVVANVVTFLATLLAIAELLFLLIQMQRKTRTGSLFVWVTILCISLLGSAIIGIISATERYHSIITSDGGVIVFDVFFQLFTALIFISLLVVGEHSTIVAACNNTSDTQASASTAPFGSVPGAMIPQQQMVHGQPMYIYLPQQNQGFQPQYPPGQPIYQHQPVVPGQSQQYYQVMPAHPTQAPQQFQRSMDTSTPPRTGDSAVSPVEASASPPVSHPVAESISAPGGTAQQRSNRASS